MARLALCFLGPFRVTLDGAPVTGFAFSKLRALLAYLAVEASSAGDAGRAHPREALAGLLWPDCPNATALANLRNALAQLRRAIGDVTDGPPPAHPYLLITRETVQVNPESDYALDVADFERHMAASRRSGAGASAGEHLRAATALYRGRFLEGLASSDSEPFEEWATLQREHLDQLMLGALERLADADEQVGDYAQAEGHARRQLKLDPAREGAHRQLMRALALGGQPDAALAQYEVCRRTLARELDVEPARETTALCERIREGALGGRRHATTAPAAPLLPEDEAPDKAKPPFVARAGELAALHSMLDKALAGEGRVAFVTGEPGSGKTALVHEFARRAMERHPELLVASGSANAYTGLGDPYLPFVEVLQMLTGDIEAQRAGGSLTREHARRLRAAFPVALQALVECGPELVDTLLPSARLLALAQSLAPGQSTWRMRLEELAQRPMAGAGQPGLQQAGLFERLTRVLRALARTQPLMLVLDDLQWADAGSISLFFHLGRRLAGSRILVVGTYRTTEVVAGRQGEAHPLEPVLHEFQRLWGDPPVDLGQAEGREFVEALLDSQPNHLSNVFRETLYRHTEGQALFTVELLRGLQERGDPAGPSSGRGLRRDEAGRWVEGPDLDWEALPTRVEAVIAQHMRRLPAEQRALLAVASVEGEEFTAEVVARAQEVGDARGVIACLSEELGAQQHLVRAVSMERIALATGGEQRLSRYGFRHHLFQHYLYHSLDEVRRIALHEQVGHALEALYGATPPQAPLDPDAWMGSRIAFRGQASGDRAGVAIAPQLAWHCEAAGQTDRAVAYLQQAAERAINALAYQEAIAHVTRAVALLQARSATDDANHRGNTALGVERIRTEYLLQQNLANLFQVARGPAAPQCGQAGQRAFVLAQRLNDLPWVCDALARVADYHRNRAELGASLQTEEEGLARAQQEPSGYYRAMFLQCSGTSLFHRGQLVTARQRMEQSLEVAGQLLQGDALLWSRHLAMVQLIQVLSLLGYHDQAAQMHERGPGPCENPYIAHPAELWLHLLRREWGDVQRHAERRLGYTAEKVWFGPQQSMDRVFLGAALAHTGRVEEGIAEMREGLASYQAVGNKACLSAFLAMLADGYAQAGRIEEGLATVAEALEHVERTGERYCEAEIYRIKGELLVKDEGEGTSPPAPVRSGAGRSTSDSVAPECTPRAEGSRGADCAEACFLKAIVIAREQEARSWELRATVGLARLWRGQGKGAEAREALAGIYGWFTEGFGTPDLVEARGLLEELTSLGG